jgi:DNA invertase Pin-like site-specific DNA recombinase
MTYAFSYIRFSSVKQQEGDSLRRQSEAIKSYVAKHGLTLSEQTYKDLGVSAFRSKNVVEGELGTFIKAIDEGKVPVGSHLLVEDFDRLSRAPVMTALHLLQTIIAKGVKVVTLTDEKLYSVETLNANWTDLVVALAKMSRAHEENTRKANAVRDAWNAKRVSGEILTAMGPGWLQLSADRKKWLLVRDKVETVRRIFELAKHGHGAPTIARMLNEEKRAMLKGKNKRSADGHNGWQSGTVAHVLKNSAVIGTYTPKKASAPPRESYYPEIIKPSLFNEVQAHIRSRTGKGGRKGEGIANLFSGMSYCQACGSKMRAVSASGRNTYLRCLRAYSSHDCDAPKVPYLAVEDAVLTRLINAQVRRFIDMTDTETADPTEALRGEIAIKQEKVHRYVDSIGGGESSAPKSIVATITKLEAEIERLEQQLKNVVMPAPRADAWKEAIALRRDHDALLNDPSKVAELTELRGRMRAAIRRIITKVEFAKISSTVTLTFASGTVRELHYESFKLPKGFQEGNVKGRARTPS